MNWFYADGSQQKGPLTDMALAALVQQGAIKPETLVWREGQPDWQPLSRVRPDLAAATGAPVIGGVAVTEQSKDLVVQQMREGALAPGGAAANPYGLRYAGFWIRVGAKLIDGIIIGVVSVPIMMALFAGMGLFSGEFVKQMEAEDPEAIGKLLGLYAVIFLIMIVGQLGYNGLLVWKWGATIGKLAVGIKVVTPEGQPLTLGRSIGRAAADMINNFICNGLTYIMVGIDEPQKRGLHDHIAGTRVVFK